MPSFAEKRPDLFWEAAHVYERKNARTAASQVIALPKELTVQQRIELAEALIKQFTDEFNFPYTAAIHNHVERSADKINRTCISCIVKDRSMNITELLNSFLVAITTKTLQLVEQKVTPDVRERQNDHQ
jgi:hypothetical protein